VGGSGASNPSVPIKPPLRLTIVMHHPLVQSYTSMLSH
jgi:hypothetical protein